MNILAETGYPKATLGENALVFLGQISVSVWGLDRRTLKNGEAY